ncbi:manganese efflux pump [candidate division KSB1 bacterium]|nr:manganese efflux pump [candidate division KSB1 bacterium]
MTFLEMVLIAVGLAMDAFAVSLAVGTTPFLKSPRAKFRISFHFGLFQFLMPVAGWLLICSIARYIQTVDHWIAFGLLFFLGVKMIYTALGKFEEKYTSNPSRGFNLILLSLAVSIDALAVGLSLGMLGISIWTPTVIIGLITALISLSGILLGRVLGIIFGRVMEVVGGIILIIIGTRILLIHLNLI